MTRLHENADVSTGVLEVVDYNSESFYLNEDDDVSPSIITYHIPARGCSRSAGVGLEGGPIE